MNRFRNENFKSIINFSQAALDGSFWPEFPVIPWLSAKTLFVVTDGSCVNNGFPNATASWGFIPYAGGSLLDSSLGSQVVLNNSGLNKGLVSVDSKDVGYLGAKIHSNNTGEVTALCHAFRWVFDYVNGFNGFDSVIFLSDSTYALNGILGLHSGKENLSLVESSSAELDRLQRKIVNIAFLKVKAHSKHKWNELVDVLAKSVLPLVPRVVTKSKSKLNLPVRLINTALLENKNIFRNNVEHGSFLEVLSLGLNIKNCSLANLKFDIISFCEENLSSFIPIGISSVENNFMEKTLKTIFQKASMIDSDLCIYREVIKGACLLYKRKFLFWSIPDINNSGDAVLVDMYDASGTDAFPQINFLVNNSRHFDFILRYLYYSDGTDNLVEASPTNNKPDHRFYIPPVLPIVCLTQLPNYSSHTSSSSSKIRSKSIFPPKFSPNSPPKAGQDLLINPGILDVVPISILPFGFAATVLVESGADVLEEVNTGMLGQHVISPLVSQSVVVSHSKMCLRSDSSDPSRKVSHAKPKRNNLVSKEVSVDSVERNMFLPFDCFKIDMSSISILNTASVILSPLESYKRMPICNFIHANCVPYFQLLTSRIIDVILFIFENKLQSSFDILLSHCIQCFYFIPTLALTSTGKSKSSSALKSILCEILMEKDFIKLILGHRDSFIEIFSPKLFKKYKSKDISSLTEAQKLKIDDLVSHNKLSKAMEFINSVFENGSVEIMDSDSEVKPIIQDTFKLLHPEKFDVPGLVSDNSKPVTPLEINLEDFRLIINQLPIKSANGLSSWSNDIIKYICNFNVSENDDRPNFFFSSRVEFSFFKLTNFLIKGEGGNVNLWINSLLIFVSKEGKKTLRPLAIDEVFIRLVSKSINSVMSISVGEKLTPIQYGVGIKGGCEYVSHSVSMWVEEILKDPGSNKIIIRLDKKNAFNSIPRVTIRRGILKHCPELLWYFDWCYGSCTRLALVNGIVLGYSSCGVRQGDPLGPLFYCLGLDQVLFEAQERFPTVDFLYYLDDGFIHGVDEDVFHAYDFLKFQLASINQILDTDDPKKCVIFAALDSSRINFPFELKVSTEGLLVLGCPYGSPDFIDTELLKIISKLSILVKRLELVDSKCAYLLIKYCINTKGSYLARVCSPWCISKHAERFDSIIDNLIALWCEVPSIDDLSSKMRSLPWGLKLPRLQDIAAPAFSSSFALALEKGRDSRNNWKWAIDYGDLFLNRYVATVSVYIKDFSFSSANLSISQQNTYSSLVFENAFNNIFASRCNEKELCSFLISLKLLYSPECDTNCWLNSFKVSNRFKEVSFSNQNFRDSVKFRILVSRSYQAHYNCICKSPSSSNSVSLSEAGDIDLSSRCNMFHCLSCIITSGTIARHNRIRDFMNSFIVRFCPNAITQVEFIYKCGVNGNTHHVDLMVKFPFGSCFGHKEERIFYLDVSVFNVGCPSHSCNSIEKAKAKFKDRETHKRNQYKDVLLNSSPNFIPIILDTVGNIGKSAKDFFVLLSRETSKINKDDFLKSFVDCLQIILFKGLSDQSVDYFKAIDESISEYTSV